MNRPPRSILARARAGALAAVAVLALAALALPARAPAQGTPQAGSPAVGAAAGTAGPAEDLGRFRGSVVRIEARAVDGAPSAETLGRRRIGSGVVIGDRVVLTIGYLLLETETVDVVTASGRRIPAGVGGYDHATGFGLVRTALPIDGQPMELGDSDAVRERQRLLTLGHGEAEATELHVLSRKPFSGSWEYLLERPIYTFPPVNNWSGSALMTEDGKLVGIGSLVVNDAAAERRGVPGNLFVPVNLVKPILADLLAAGRRKGPAQPWLGLGTEPVRGHLMVVRVSRDGPAEGAGIGPGDIILAVDGEQVSDQADFYRRVWKLGPAGTEVPLKLLKGSTVRDVKVRSVDRMDVLSKPAGV
jgi:S1-C subfamily serine protease